MPFQFHRRLKEGPGIEVTVLARVLPVRVVSADSGDRRGRKETYDARRGDWVNHRPRSKFRFGWADGEQIRTWVDYGTDAGA